ncbi:MAG: tetratricopeptide repeat protein [Pyrinomonadaceae bacterium]
MKLLAVFLIFVALMSACSSCGRNAANSNIEANANVEAESQFANITDANAALAEGKRLLDENDVELAIAALRKAVELNPELAEGYFQLGIAYSLLEMQLAKSGEVIETESNTNAKQGRKKPNSEKAFEKAVEAYKKLLKTNPGDDAAQFNLGRTYAKLNKDEEAEEAFNKAVELKPDDTEYQTELGGILIKLARYSEAIEPLKKAIELDESNSRAIELLEDAKAGRQRLNYQATPKNTNTGNSNANSNANASSNSNSAPKAVNSNTKPKPAETKKPNTVANKPERR